ncbi:hypothetical protein ACWCQR_52425, partial [Streptomyces sp. NPDC002172]
IEKLTGLSLRDQRDRTLVLLAVTWEALGTDLGGSFEYVVAINYNRQTGTSPLDWTRPMGANRGGGVWLHVDHGGPTHACVSVAKAHMKELLRTLDPDRHPVIAMGFAGWLAR